MNSMRANAKSGVHTVQIEVHKGSRLRVRLLAVSLAVLIAAALMLFVVRPAYVEAQLREAYLPDLARAVSQSPFDARLQALYGARLAQAGEYKAAADAFQFALGAGENSSAVWLGLAASVAVSTGKPQAYAALKMGVEKSVAPSLVQEAIDRCALLPPAASADTLADSILPGGPARIVDIVAKGSWLNGIVAWWGRAHPGQSGFETRQRWATEQPRNVQAQILWAEALLANRRHVEAMQVAQRIIVLDARAADGYRLLGDSYRAQGAFAKAGLQYIAAMKIKPNWPPALLPFGQCALNLKLLAVSVDAFQRAVKVAPKSPDAWIGLGTAYYNQHIQYGDALNAFRTAERLAPMRTDFFADYSNTLRANFKMDEAEACLRRRLAEAPQDARCSYLLALILQDHKPSEARTGEAEKCLRTALQIEPDQSAATAQLGKLLLETNRYAEAVPVLKQAVKADEFDTPSLLNLSRAYRALGRKQEAQAAQDRFRSISQYVARQNYLEDQLRRQPLNVDLHLALADHYLKGGQTSRARTVFDAAYMLETDHARASRALKMLNNNTVPAPTVPGK